MRVSEAFLGKTCARSGSLASFELGIGFADDIHRALALHDLAVGVAALGGGEGGDNFHDSRR